jgi:hypothetical protein
MKEKSKLKKSNIFRFRTPESKTRKKYTLFRRIKRVFSIKLKSNQMDKTNLKKKVIQSKSTRF